MNGYGNNYSRIQFGTEVGKSAKIPAIIPPGGYLADELFFEAPSLEASELTLRLRQSDPIIEVIRQITKTKISQKTLRTEN